LKPEPSFLAHSLRALTLTITLVTLVALSTVGYTICVNVSDTLNLIGGNSRTPAITAETVIQDSTATFYLNVTFTNNGFYPVGLSLTCIPPNGSGIACDSPSIAVLPGQSKTLHFVMTEGNSTQGLVSHLHIDGMMEVTLKPFASIDLAVDLGSLISRGN